LWNDVEQKGKLKEKLGFRKDQFIIGLAGDIKGFRKSWAENLEGVKLFIERNPKVDIGVFIHTRESPLNAMDFDIKKLVKEFVLEGSSRLVGPLDYIRGVPEDEFSEIYNAFDVFLHCSRGEGGSMMLLEAQACGVPVVATDFTAQPQVVGEKSGVLVQPVFKMFDPNMMKRAIPNPKEIAVAIETLHNELVTDMMKVRHAAVSFANGFDWEKKIFPMWRKTLKMLEVELPKSGLKILPPSDELKEKAKVVKLIE